MRVLLAHKLWHVKGGVERYVLNLSELLRGRGHEVVPFTCEHPRNEPTGYEAFYPPYRDLSRPRLDGEGIVAAANIIYSREARRALSGLLDAVRPDVAHCRNIYHHLSPSILYELKRRGIPSVMTIADYKLVCPAYRLYRDGVPCDECVGGRYVRAVRHRCVKGSLAASALSSFEAYAHRVTGAYLRNLDLILAPSRFARDVLTDSGIPPEKVAILPHFIDARSWRTAAEDEPSSARPYVVVFGRLSEEKGVDVAIRAMRHVREADLCVVGEGPEEQRLHALAETEAPGKVRFLGYRQGEDLRAIVAGSRGVIMPSVCNEVFGLSVLEAFALGKPVVGSRIGAIPELVREGETGLTFSVRDDVELAEKVSRLVARPLEAREMGGNARRLVEAEYGPETHYERLMEVYASVIR